VEAEAIQEKSVASLCNNVHVTALVISSVVA
jgi:hypothetical protein